MARGHGRQNGREKVDEGMDVEVTDGGGSDGDSGGGGCGYGEDC